MKSLFTVTILWMIARVGLLGIFGVNSCSAATVTLQPIATGMQLPSPSAYPIEITDDKGIPMRLVPAGEFTMGSDAHSDKCADHKTPSICTV